MNVISCTHAAHAEAILAIFNEAIATSTALYDYQPRTADSMVAWFAAKAAGNYPVIGAIDADGTLLGFASYGPFRAFPAYKYSVEHSIYVHREHRGQGLGRALLERLVQQSISGRGLRARRRWRAVSMPEPFSRYLARERSLWPKAARRSTVSAKSFSSSPMKAALRRWSKSP